MKLRYYLPLSCVIAIIVLFSCGCSPNSPATLTFSPVSGYPGTWGASDPPFTFFISPRNNFCIWLSLANYWHPKGQGMTATNADMPDVEITLDNHKVTQPKTSYTQSMPTVDNQGNLEYPGNANYCFTVPSISGWHSFTVKITTKAGREYNYAWAFSINGAEGV